MSKDFEYPSNAELASLIDELGRKFEAHMAEERKARGDAFPDGDLHGHRKYHEEQIEAARAQAQFYRTLTQRAAETGLIGLIKLIGTLAILGFGAWLSTHFGGFKS